MSHDAHIAFFMNALRPLLLRLLLLLLLLLLEIAILGLTHRKHGVHSVYSINRATPYSRAHTVHAAENPFCILQPNNKRCSSSRPPVSLSLRSVRSCSSLRAWKWYHKSKKKNDGSDTKKDAREKSYCGLLLFSYLFQLTSRLVRSPFNLFYSAFSPFSRA